MWHRAPSGRPWLASEREAIYPLRMSEPAVDPADLRFEAAIQELESIIERIDAGEIGLEEAMVAHRRGKALVARCRQVLDAVAEELESVADESPADPS